MCDNLEILMLNGKEVNEDEIVNNIYTSTLIHYLGIEGKAVAHWLSVNTKPEEFWEQPLNFHKEDRLLIHHGVKMIEQMIKLSKVINSTSINGVYSYFPQYKNDDFARVSLYHILGNIGKFKKEIRNKKIDGRWLEVPTWIYNEKIKIYGTDSQKAVLLIQDIMCKYGLAPIKEEVLIAIMNIRGIWENQSNAGMYPQLYEQSQLALLAYLADLTDTFMKEPVIPEQPTDCNAKQDLNNKESKAMVS